MEDTTKTILVPWDFTEIAENALEHAIKFAKIINKDVTLVHVVKKAKESEEAEKKLKEIADKIAGRENITVHALVKEGSIFHTINEAADDEHAALAIMGTHGIKGMQKFLGSWALKVIVGSKIPFLVVQQKPVTDILERIVFPVEFKHEDKEKLRWANYLAKFYNVKVLIVTNNITDPGLKKKTQANITFAKRYLESKDIDYEIDSIDSKDFAKDVSEYAKEKNAQLILIMTSVSPSIADYAFGANEQKIIANEAKIPVMCVNPRQDLIRFGGFAAGG